MTLATIPTYSIFRPPVPNRYVLSAREVLRRENEIRQRNTSPDVAPSPFLTKKDAALMLDCTVCGRVTRHFKSPAGKMGEPTPICIEHRAPSFGEVRLFIPPAITDDTPAPFIPAHVPPPSKTFESYVQRQLNMVDGDIRPAPIVVDDWPKITTPEGYIVDDPDIVRCDYCNDFCTRDRATFGRGPLHKAWIEERTKMPDGTINLTRKLIHTTNRQTACPDCCLNITDVKFGETKG